MAGRNFSKVTKDVRANDYVNGRRVVAQMQSKGKNKVKFEDGGSGTSGG